MSRSITQSRNARLVPVRGFSGRLVPGPSAVETEHCEAIDACWRRALAEKPKMFNGRVLLAESVGISDGALHAAYREIAFATLIWLREQEPNPPPLYNVFGAAAVVSRDGAALLGRMGPHTANAGQVYFPCGTPDLGDVTEGGVVDLEGSILRELSEETGLAAPEVRASEQRLAVFDGAMVAFIRRFDTDLDAEELAALGARHIASEEEPELDRILLARSSEELGAELPLYARLALKELLGT